MKTTKTFPTLPMSDVRLPRNGSPLKLQVVQLDKFHPGNGKWGEGDEFLYGQEVAQCFNITRKMKDYGPRGDTLVQIMGVG